MQECWGCAAENQEARSEWPSICQYAQDRKEIRTTLYLIDDDCPSQGSQGRHWLIEPSEAGIPRSAELGAAMEEYLGDLNIEYAHKRQSGRLWPLVVHILRGGSAEAYKALCIDRGQREGQFNAMALQYLEDLHFPYEQYTR